MISDDNLLMLSLLLRLLLEYNMTIKGKKRGIWKMENLKVKHYNYCLAPFCLPCYYVWRTGDCAVQRELHCTLRLKNAQLTPLFYRGNVLRVRFSFSTKASLVIAGNSVRMNELNGWDGQNHCAFLVVLSSWAISETCSGPLGPTPPPLLHPPLHPLRKKIEARCLSPLFCSPLLAKEGYERGYRAWGVFKGLAHKHFLHAACFVLWLLVGGILLVHALTYVKPKHSLSGRETCRLGVVLGLKNYQEAPAAMSQGRKCENRRRE